MSNNSDVTVFLTVGTEKQKILSEKLVSEIAERYGLDIEVVSDEDFGGHVGSGGAVLNIIKNGYHKNRKAVIINSGGMSKRSFNYALRGKAFANVMYDGKTMSLFELIVLQAQKLIPSFSSGILIYCSDIPVDTGDEKVRFDKSISFCIGDSFNTGSRHGVMIGNEDGEMTYFLHKYPFDELSAICSSFGYNKALIDTGMLYITDELAEALYNMIDKENFLKKLEENQTEINLYSDILYLLSKNIDKERYLNEDTKNCVHRKLKEILFDYISKFSADVHEVTDFKFMHFGTMKESLKNIVGLSGLKNGYLALNSSVAEESSVADGTVLDNTVLVGKCIIGSNCIVSDVELCDVKIDDGKTVCGIKLCNGKYVSIICDIDENPKDTVNGTELWDLPRFYADENFTDSFKKFISGGDDEEKYSLKECIEQADFDYYFQRKQSLDKWMMLNKF